MVERQEIEPYLQRIDHLAHNIQENFPDTLDPTTLEFRAELTGLLLVSIVANYENCVKKIISIFASSHSSQFGRYVNKKYERLNSQIRKDDLKRYYEHFQGSAPDNNFIQILKQRNQNTYEQTHQYITNHYKQILEHRHNFAHSGAVSTTLEEVIPAHGFAKEVIFAFYDALIVRN